ncbi:MAG: class I SAM-dependent rRNA methyltransferase [Rhodospirillaceae bacterium]|jgi:23S rRNA (cytosine1962-C5)-methyltransferase|nr:class I SAM-dependent rRNA methyltransferase [Rhodospirillaceae bacterium]MBT5459985.1 class I SAM-dependent rRNA methyltransferase [Rhodospirillaceae bacterium]
MTQPAEIQPGREIIRLSAGRHKRAQLGHPWIFSNEIEMIPSVKALAPGSAVSFSDASGQSLGTGFFNPHSLIAGRILSRDGADMDQSFIEDRLSRALALRQRLFDQPYYRLVHAEADGMPGLIVDRYNDVLVVQPNAAGMDRILDQIIAALNNIVSPRAILVKGDSAARRLEGLQPDVRWVGSPPDGPQEIIEGGVTFLADLGDGQKTGWFFDHATNRALVARFAENTTVLDLYCYLGGFALQAARAGATAVTGIDRSEQALALATQSAELSGLSQNCTFQKSTAFDAMGDLAKSSAQYGIVVADPPAFVKSRKDLKAGARGYRKMARLAAPLVAPGGLLFVASCSHHVDMTLFAQQIRRGLSDTNRQGRILHSGGAGPDHPVHPHLPESAYLKFQFLQLD